MGTGSITLSNQEKVTINGNISFLNQTKVPTISGTMGFANSNFYINNDIINNYDGDYYLGLSGSRWKGVYATNGTINTSDAREKENIHALNYGLSQVMQLKPVTFTWRKRREEGTKIGVVAQDLQTVLPEVVADKEWSKDENGNSISKDATRLGVYYSDIIPVLTKAIQEQQAMIEALQKEMAAMKKKMGE